MKLLIGESVWNCKDIVESSAQFLCRWACVRVGVDVNMWFTITVGLIQDCVMSL